jgi:hypothetical protein
LEAEVPAEAEMLLAAALAVIREMAETQCPASALGAAVERRVEVDLAIKAQVITAALDTFGQTGLAAVVG